MRSRVAATRPHLTRQHKVNRLAWARIHRRWNRADWKNCLFTDEAKFCRRSADRTVRVWRRRAENRYSDNLVNTTEPFGGGGVLVWGGICFGGRSDLVIIHGNLNSDRYVRDILEPHVLAFAGAIDPERFVLVDDNARPHRAHCVDNFLEDHGIERMIWPAKSPDMNPIENVWGLLKRRISRLIRPEDTIQDLENVLVREWDDLPQEYLDKCVLSMRRRTQACVRSMGSHTKY